MTRGGLRFAIVFLTLIGTLRETWAQSPGKRSRLPTGSFQFAVNHKDGAQADSESVRTPASHERLEKLTVTVGDILTRIDGPKLWTLSGVDYQGSPIAVEDSAYGSVLNIKGVGILGSAHFLDVPGKPGQIEKEQISLVEFFLDGRRVTEITPVLTLTGKSFRMRRESNIRAVRLKSDVTLRDGVLIESVRMQTTEAVELKVSYPLMYAWSPHMSEYLFGNANGIQKRGVFLTAPAKANEGLEKSSRWMAVYNPKNQKGAVLSVSQTPKTEEVWLQFTDAPGVYRKLRLMSFSEKTMPAGFDGTFEVAVGFFSAAVSEWELVAQKRLRELELFVSDRPN